MEREMQPMCSGGLHGRVGGDGSFTRPIVGAGPASATLGPGALPHTTADRGSGSGGGGGGGGGRGSAPEDDESWTDVGHDISDPPGALAAVRDVSDARDDAQVLRSGGELLQAGGGGGEVRRRGGGARRQLGSGGSAADNQDLI